MRPPLALLSAAILCAGSVLAQARSSAHRPTEARAAPAIRIALLGPRSAPIAVPGVDAPLRIDLARGVIVPLPSHAGARALEQLVARRRHPGSHLHVQILTLRSSGTLHLARAPAAPVSRLHKTSAMAGSVHVHVEHVGVRRADKKHFDLIVKSRFTTGHRVRTPVRHAHVSLHWRPAHHKGPHKHLAHARTGHDGRVHFKVRLATHAHLGHTYEFRIHFHEHGRLPHTHHDFRHRLR